MDLMFAHGEPICKPNVRHKRILDSNVVRYKAHMPNKIQKIRKSKGLTQQQVFELAGISKAYYSELETGKKQLNERTLGLIAEAMGVEPYMLLAEPEDSDAVSLFDDYAMLDPAARKIVAGMARQLAEAKRQET